MKLIKVDETSTIRQCKITFTGCRLRAISVMMQGAGVSTIAAPKTSSPPPFAARRANAPSKSFHIASLDGIRGLAFLLVFFAHTGLGFVIPGGFGVTVFFILSGYLITTLLRLEVEETGRIDFKAFYMRRTLRILPVFYVVLGLALLLHWCGLTGGYLHREAILSQLTQWSNYYLIGHGPDSVVGGTIPLWSLAVEEHFYLIFPVLYWWTHKHVTRRAQVILLIGVCTLCLTWRCLLIFVLHAPSVRSELGTDTRFDGLLFGALMAIGLNPALDKSRWFSSKRLAWIAPMAFACLLFTFSWRNPDFRFTLRYTLQGLALLPLFAYGMLSRGSMIFRGLNSRLMAQVGVLSYALYLVHAIFLDIFDLRFHVPKILGGALALASAILTAKLIQLLVERPLQRLRKNYSRVHAPFPQVTIADGQSLSVPDVTYTPSIE